MRRKEFFTAGALLLLALLLWLSMRPFRPADGSRIRITKDGELYGIWSLSDDRTIPIGDSNICEIRDGSVRMIHASCPDQLCIHQGAIGGKNGTGMIVCLPNRVIIEVISDGPDTRPDAVT